jgi:ribosomal protein S18 acetylase RimI-like enzyme
MSDSQRDRSVVIAVGGSEWIDSLEPLWLTLFDHHVSVGPGPFIDRGDSWQHRRRFYTQVLAEPDAFVVVALREERAVGYALVAMHQGPDDPWPTGDRYAEVETLAVVPKERGQGIGTQLLDEVDRRLQDLGVMALFIGVMVGNDDALRFYERRGLTPAITKLMRLDPIHLDEAKGGGVAHS